MAENIAIYARVSTDTQDARRQIQDCKQTADQRDATIEVYADRGVSGATTDRAQFQQLRQDVATGDIDTVLATEASRIGRSFIQTVEFIKHCYDNDVKFEVLDGAFPVVDPAEENQMAMKYAELMAWVADLEREFIRQRITSGVANAQRQGKWTGRPPFGFTTDDDGYLVVTPDEYMAMQAALELVETDNDMSLSAAARHTGVPKASLSRIANDADRRDLYLYGDAADDRVADALDTADVTHDTALQELRDELDALKQEVRDHR